MILTRGVAFTENHLVIYPASCFSIEVFECDFSFAKIARVM